MTSNDAVTWSMFRKALCSVEMEAVIKAVRVSQSASVAVRLLNFSIKAQSFFGVAIDIHPFSAGEGDQAQT